jgi:hypothetical protein
MSSVTPPGPPEPRREPGEGQQAYNIVTDTVTGANVRLWDNLFQAAAIGACFVLGTVIGVIAVSDRILGGVLGGFIGLLAGLFGSGIFLMVFRAVRHTQGRHD